MKTNDFNLGLSALSQEATSYVQGRFGDSFYVTVKADRLVIKTTRSGYAGLRSFSIVLNSDYALMLEFPRVSINYRTAGEDQNFFLLRAATSLIDDCVSRSFIHRLFNDLNDLVADYRAGS